MTPSTSSLATLSSSNTSMATPYAFFQRLFRFTGFGGTAQYSGEQGTGPTTPPSAPVRVTEDSALALSTVFGASRILAETVAGIPLHAYALKNKQWVDDPTDELYTLLQVAPNPHMTHIDFWEAVMLNLTLRGNGYALVLRNALGNPIGLYPLAAAQVQPIVLKDGTGWYIYNLDGVQTMYAEDDVLHFRIFGNGRVGLSPLEYGAMSMGLASAADKYAGTFYQRGAKPGGVLQIDRILTPKQRSELRESFKEVHENVENAHKLFVLEAGMKYQQVQLSPEGAQLIESRKFNVKDVARFFGVPTFLLNESEGSTSWGTGLEQQMMGFYNLTIAPYTRRIAATCRQRLIPVSQQRRRKLGYDFDELMAVDLRAKAEYYTKLTTAGIMTRNEARERILLPRSTETNADALTVQGAMVAIGDMGKAPQTEGTSNEDRT